MKREGFEPPVAPMPHSECRSFKHAATSPQRSRATPRPVSISNSAVSNNVGCGIDV